MSTKSTTVVATASGVRAEHVTVPLPEPGVARLSFDNGLEHFALGAAGRQDTLLDAELAPPLPVVWTTERGVHLAYPSGSRLLRRAGRSTVRLNPAHPWALDLHGGAARLDADLTGIDLHSLTCYGGGADLRLVLDRPTAPRTLRLTSVDRLRVERPAGVAVRLEIAKGARDIVLDGQHFGAVGGGLTVGSDTGDGGEPGYLIAISGSAAAVTVAERSA